MHTNINDTLGLNFEMALSPKIIATSSHPQNRGACDWGWSGLLAHGSHQYIVVADPTSSQVTQVLGVHKGLVTCVKWKPEDIHHDVVVNPYTLTLAAGDTHGDVILWNVTKGEPKSTFVRKGRVVQDITWITNQETSEAAILVLYNKGLVIMWDFLTSSQLWQTSFTEPISSICIDPFNKCNAVFLCEDSNILLVEDLHPKAAPSQKYRRISFYGTAGPCQEVSPPGYESATMRRNSSSLNKFINMTTSLITGTAESRSSRKSMSEEDRSFQQQCLQVVHHPGIRHVIFMVYPSQVDIIDTEVCIVMATIRLDSKSSYFVRVLPCKQKDALYCLHENACITIRVRRQDKSHCTFNESQVSTPSTPVLPGCNESGADKSDITYDLIWQSDSVRLSNQSTVYGFGLHPVTEAGAALIFSDGKIILWELVNTRIYGLVLKDMFPGLSKKGQKNTLMKESRFLLTGMVKGFPSHICTIRSNLLEQVTTTNNPGCKAKDSLLALGMENGGISLLNIQTGQIEREISVHSDSVKGIEWINQNILLSWTCSKSGNSPTCTTGRNEVFLTWIRSGLVELFRYRQKLESLITNIKVSPLRQYVVIAFKSQPLEVWCIQTKSLLRELPASFPHPRALTWAPLCSWKTVVRQLSQSVMNKDITDMTQADITNLLHDKEYKKIAREQCVLADKDGTICRITLEERAVWDITIYPPEVNGMSAVTHIAMKDDMLILGDATGVLCLWNLTEKKLKSVPRSGDKPYPGLKAILFNPSTRDHFFAVLYDQGVDIWLFSQHHDKLKLLGSVKHSKNMPKVKLLEWADLNHVSMVMDDGSIHVVEFASSKVTSSWNQRNTIDTVFCPHTLPVQGSLILKHLLQNATRSSMEYRLTADKAYLKRYIDTQLELINRETLNLLTNEKYGTAERCLTTARLFGDEFDVNFWTTAQYFLNHEKDERNNSRKDHQLISVGDEALTDNGSACYTDHSCSEAYLDCLRPQSCYVKQQFHRVEQHNKKRKSQANRHRCIQKFTMMGRLEEATKILLETDFHSGSYREDYLQACLLSSDRTNSTAQSTLKLVATHLIISGNLEEGVVILCLLDKVLDACRYLQTYNQWEEAAWLAKVMLNEKDCEEVFLKWIEHLTSTKQMLHAIYIMMSRSKFDDVLKTLHYIGYIETAACFLKASQEIGFQLTKDEAETVMEKYHSHVERLGLQIYTN
ncbi:WD repeat-containing protein 11-like isoform X2 [Ostrea edulis]|uniref:WD repeat-containing protein 11-like isoform X2 n=1 Tax=Ostrea edulis TaxID=37623 RepID=UPI0024AF85FA|nr:WD repeat-containing protein 11-like isoform X2 [Ostrea edulis]